MFNIFKNKKVPEFPLEIEIQEYDSNEPEVLESWTRRCHKNHVQFHSVDAVLLKDEEYPWELYFGAGEFIREEPYVNDLNMEVYNAILSVKGVESAYHEDTEKYVITGSPSGKNLVRTVSEAIDKYIRKNITQWKESLKT